jgi:HEPN domain-containing protein
MSVISVYSFEDSYGNENGTWTTINAQEAREHAVKYGLRVIENVYEWTESVPVAEWDFSRRD